MEGQSTELMQYTFAAIVTTVPWQQKALRFLFRSLHLFKFTEDSFIIHKLKYY